MKFNNFWKNVFTQGTTGRFSLFAPAANLFAVQQAAINTAMRIGGLQGIKEGLIDAFNHLYIRTSPMLRSYQGPPKRYIKKPIITEDDEIVARYIIE